MEVCIYNRKTIEFASPEVPYALISVTEATSTFPSIHMEALGTLLQGALFLKFADSDDPTDTSYPPITDDQARAIAAFVEANKSVDLFVVNCDAGISRSSAIGAAILYHFTKSDRAIFKDSRYVPNMFVYRKLLYQFLFETPPSGDS
jgi:predicted protein tyrosine phosphatase